MIVGYTTGVFDMFHIGHLRLLQRAREHCDELIVGISTDELVLSHKKVKLVIPYEDRAEIVAGLKCVDKIVPQTNYDKIRAWENLNFDRMFVGSDWKGTPQWLQYEKLFANFRVDIVYFDYTIDISSSKLRVFIEENFKLMGRP